MSKVKEGTFNREEREATLVFDPLSKSSSATPAEPYEASCYDETLNHIIAILDMMLHLHSLTRCGFLFFLICIYINLGQE